MEQPNKELNISNTVNFKGDCGEASGSTPNSAVAESGGMQPGQQASINNSPVSNCVVGNDGAQVFSISLLNIAGIYDYQVSVDGQGPSGITGGSFYLAFTDASGDTYYLSIYSSSRETHTVDYNSDAPDIVTIWWSDKSFKVPSSNNTKPDYKTTSPVRK